MQDARTMERQRLASGSIGFPGQLFQSITHMAPAASIIFGAPYMASKGGGSLALAFLLALAACIMTSWCLKELVRKVRSAGGYFVIHSVILGRFLGFTTSWLWFLNEPSAPAGLAVLFPLVLNDFLSTTFQITFPWWIISIIMVTLLTYISFSGIRESSRITILLGSCEIGIMFLLGVVLIIRAGSHQPVVSFTSASSPNSWGGVFFAAVFGINCFFGFEAGVPLSEESFNAKRSLTRAILISTIGIGIFYCLLGYATVAGWGFRSPQQFANSFSNATNPYITLGGEAFGLLGPWLMLLVITNSTLAASLAAQNAVTRVYYSLGRARVFPSLLGRVHPATLTPANAIFLQGIITLTLALTFGFLFGPFNGYGLIILIATVGMLIVYIITNISCIVIYLTRYRDEFNIIRHLVIPIAATLTMVLPLIAALAPQLLFGFSNTYPFNLTLPITAIWFGIGIVLYCLIRWRRPGALQSLANEMAYVELVGEDDDPTSRATADY